MSSSFLMHLVLCLSVFLCHFAALSQASSNATDEHALLTFKSMLYDPTGMLASWNTSNRLCDWQGVKCGSRHRQLNRVVALDLDSFHLSGTISPSLANLSFLRRLELANNRLQGQVPEELGHLFRLRVLNLSLNALQGSIPTALALYANLTVIDLRSNSLQGKIPSEISSLRGLTSLHLGKNNLSGHIPPSFGNLSNLNYLGLNHNLLSGSIPPTLGDLNSLGTLELTSNNLSGDIPSSLGQLTSITYLSLSLNNLSGTLPPSIWNISSLIELHANNNHLFGKIPSNIGYILPRLRNILLRNNMFYGPLPISFANASDLIDIELSSNLISGKIPPELGTLKDLKSLQVAQNFLEAEETKDWDFMTALTNCSKLQILDLSWNRLHGALPASIANLSTAITNLNLQENSLSGNIPVGIGNLRNMSGLWLACDNLTGTIPSSLGMLQNMGYLNLSGNSLSGQLPPTLGNLTKLLMLDLASNDFSGNIPSILGNLPLLLLNLSYNQFSGTIPKELVSISSLSQYLDISYNDLVGSMPSEIGILQGLEQFHVQWNNLSGEIPSSFASCVSLQILYLQDNFFQGDIPSSFGALKGLEWLDLSKNNLLGEIPKFLEDFSTLDYLNLSFNNFVGEVPMNGVFRKANAISVQGNSKLCGGIKELHLPPCASQLPRKKHKFPVLVVVVPIAVAVLCLLFLAYFFATRCKRKLSKGSLATSSFRGHILISHSQLVKATDGFSTDNLIGIGSFGSVYRGILADHGDGDTKKIVAIKVLNLQTPGALRSFTVECEAMRNLRHRNLVKIITSCSSIDLMGNYFRAIVFDYMPNGNLESWLHPEVDNHGEPKGLDLLQRVNIAFDVASALDYLHHYSATPVVHCDLKPSNVLLDADMVAHVGDFGLAKILMEGGPSFGKSTSSMGFRGTIGYAAPEYGTGNKVSVHGDVYSYGILLLEMVTGKRPTDNIFKGGPSLRKFVWMTFPDRVMNIVDEHLIRELEDGEAGNETRNVDGSTRRRRKRECITSLLKIGLWCSEERPTERMPTGDITRDLHAVKEMLMG